MFPDNIQQTYLRQGFRNYRKYFAMQFHIAIFLTVLFTTLVKPDSQLPNDVDLYQPKSFSDSNLIANSDADDQDPIYNIPICCHPVDPDYVTKQTCEICGIYFLNADEVAKYLLDVGTAIIDDDRLAIGAAAIAVPVVLCYLVFFYRSKMTLLRRMNNSTMKGGCSFIWFKPTQALVATRFEVIY